MMMSLLFAPNLPDISSLQGILIPLVVIAVIWILLRFVLKLAFRVMFIGCGAILLLGIILLGLQYIR